ncbi:MAG: hypothetical protein JO351_07990 [Candidatus Eremiobacteraeota bacterium]|nr:hypothetical protein [Candidatus Eremiobacteraeota bacterium]
MRNHFHRIATLLAVPAIFAGAPASAMGADSPAAASSPAPSRHLVYSFTYSSNGDLESHGSNGYASDTHSGAGDTRDYRGSIDDRGTISVDAVGLQPDGGLVVKISEHGQNTRSSDTVLCVTYGNTNTICDPNKQVNSEELTLLRFLAPSFADPAATDGMKQWKVDQSDADATRTADYALRSTANGVMQIDERRVMRQHGGNPATTDISTQLAWDSARKVPVSVEEYVTRRDAAMGGQNMTTTLQTTLKLVSDSMAKQ